MKKILILFAYTVVFFSIACGGKTTRPESADTTKSAAQELQNSDSANGSHHTTLFQGSINKQPGTTYTISNQTTVLINYMYGACGPTPSGDIYPGTPLTIFVASGDRLTISFLARYSAPRCTHCITQTLVGDATPNQAINLRENMFCY